MVGTNKKLFKFCLIYTCVLIVLLLGLFVKYVRTQNIEAGTVHNKSAASIVFQAMEDIKTDGRNIYLYTRDNYIIVMRSDGEIETQLFPARVRQGTDQFCVDRTSNSLLYYVPDAYILEIDKAGKILNKYDGTLSQLQQLNRFRGMNLKSMLAPQTQCTLDDGTEYELRTSFPLQKLVRTVDGKKANVHTAIVLSVDWILYHYIILGVLVLLGFLFVRDTKNRRDNKNHADTC